MCFYLGLIPILTLRISRASLNSSDEDDEQSAAEYMPNIEFDFIEVDVEDTSKFAEDDTKPSEPEEFDFPLFGTSTKVSLKEEEIKPVVQERPHSYYFSTHSNNDKFEFISSAVSYQDIFSITYPPINPTYKLIDLDLHNAEILKQLLRSSRRRSRPGQKKRKMIIECKDRKLERRKIEEKIEKERLAKLNKKKFHKRGGKKHKKTETKAKPKYKTE